MRLHYLAVVLSLATLAPMGCKSCHSSGTVSPPPPPAFPAPTSPPPVAPAVGMSLPPSDPDYAQVQPSLPQSIPASQTAQNCLASWRR